MEVLRLTIKDLDPKVLNQTIDSLIQSINSYYFSIPEGVIQNNYQVFFTIYIIAITFSITLWLFIAIMIVQYELVRKQGKGNGVKH
jgi:hypothetical protein